MNWVRHELYPIYTTKRYKAGAKKKKQKKSELNVLAHQHREINARLLHFSFNFDGAADNGGWLVRKQIDGLFNIIEINNGRW